MGLQGNLLIITPARNNYQKIFILVKFHFYASSSLKGLGIEK